MCLRHDRNGGDGALGIEHMSFRFYRSATVGDGTSPRNAIRAKLTEYIINDGTQDFSSWSYRARACQYCFADCADGAHDKIEADPDISSLSPRFTDLTAAEKWLDQPIGIVDPALVQLLEDDGFSCAWIAKATTWRELWRFIAAHHVTVQQAYGKGDASLKAMVTTALDDPAVRQTTETIALAKIDQPATLKLHDQLSF